jgi:hypothetical protein
VLLIVATSFENAVLIIMSIVIFACMPMYYIFFYLRYPDFSKLIVSESVERVNSRIDNMFGFERHTIRGLKKMNVRMHPGFVLMLASAVGIIRENKILIQLHHGEKINS